MRNNRRTNDPRPCARLAQVCVCVSHAIVFVTDAMRGDDMFLLWLDVCIISREGLELRLMMVSVSSVFG